MSIGAALAEARERAGLTVAELSDRTRIRETVIEGIEREDFSVCGGDFYARGHIRALAAALRLDPEAAVRQYDELYGGSRPPIRASSMFKVDGMLRKRGRRGSSWTMGLAVALVLIVVVAIVRLLGGSDGRSGETAARVAVPNEMQQQATARDRAARKIQPGVVVVKASARRSSYVNVRDGKGRKLFQGTLPAGKTSTWTAKDRVRVTLGDAGAVRLEVNGEDLGVAGRDGYLVRRTFAADSPGPR